MDVIFATKVIGNVKPRKKINDEPRENKTEKKCDSYQQGLSFKFKDDRLVVSLDHKKLEGYGLSSPSLLIGFQGRQIKFW